MLPSIAVPAFDGKGSPFLHYDQQVRLWCQMAHLEPSKQAPAMMLRIGSAGSGQILDTPREYFAPDAVDAGDPEVVGIARF